MHGEKHEKRKTKSIREKPGKTKNETCIQKGIDRYISMKISITVVFDRFSFEVNLAL